MSRAPAPGAIAPLSPDPSTPRPRDRPPRGAVVVLHGLGGEEDSRQAARWFMLAARKGHTAAQTMLGLLMLDGIGVRRSTVAGLMWLSIAKQRRKSDTEILALHDQAYAAASEKERSQATALAEEWISNPK